MIYAPSFPESSELLDWMEYRESAECVLIVDECDMAASKTLRQAASQCQGRLRIVSIGHEPPGGTAGDYIVNLRLASEEDAVKVAGATASLSDEQARFVGRLVHGDLRLATVMAREIAKGTVDVVNLASIHDIYEILEKLIPDEESRRVMKYLSLLRRVGWDGDVSNQGEALAEFSGISWSTMKESVGRLATIGYVAKQGRYRYVPSEIQAISLASQVVKERGDDILGLLELLPPGEAVNSAIARLGDLGTLPEARSVIERWEGPHGPFAEIDTLDNESNSDLFRILARAVPESAVVTLEMTVGSANRERLLQFRAGRRNIVWALEDLAVHRNTFFEAARLILRLAEAENESWSNNATGVWESLFLTRLGRTEVPAVERYSLLEELIDSQEAEKKLLVVSALGSALRNAEWGSPLSYEGPIDPAPLFRTPRL